jgi:anti-anti-sigma factor
MVGEPEIESGVAFFKPVGNLALNEATEFRERILRCVAEVDCGAIVLNLREIRYLDSNGLGAIVSAYKAALAAGKSLALCEPGPTNRHILQRTSIHNLMPIFDDAESALAALARPDTA